MMCVMCMMYVALIVLCVDVCFMSAVLNVVVEWTSLCFVLYWYCVYCAGCMLYE